MTKKRLLVITPYYPTIIDKANGLFIKQQVDLIKGNFLNVIVFKCKSITIKNFISDIYLNRFSYSNEGVKVYNLFYFDNKFVNRIFINKMIALKVQLQLNYYLRLLFLVKFDVVLSQWLLPTTYCFSFLSKKKIVSVVRGMDISILREEFPKYFLFALKKSDVVIGNGKYVGDIIKRLNRKSIVETIYNPKKLDMFFKLNISDKETFNESLSITCIGRLDYSKRQDLLLRLTNNLQKKGFKVILNLIGEGKGLENLKRLSIELGVEANTRFNHNLSHKQISEILKITDLYIQPSMREGVPNALAEAMASGCLCIARDVGGVTDLIEHQINGYVFKKDSELDDLVDDILTKNNKKLKFRARKKIIEIFNNKRNIDNLLKHLN